MKFDVVAEIPKPPVKELVITLSREEAYRVYMFLEYTTCASFKEDRSVLMERAKRFYNTYE
jgi:hypothetical protein